MTIPAWDSRGVLPPVRPGEEGASSERSPYKCSLESLIDRFGVTDHRLGLLNKLLDYREALHNAGLIEGFQWINGSFVQDIERQDSRPPNDIDIVTHFYLPPGETQKTLVQKNFAIIDNACVKQKYGVDVYFNPLGAVANESFVRRVSYWYSMWSHRREDNVWKGFVEINLSPYEDGNARALLSSMLSGQGGEGDE